MAGTVFARSNVWIVGLNPTRGMDVCARLSCLCYRVCGQWPRDQLISRPVSPADYVLDKETRKAIMAQ
jgi:hypothetical protein